MSSLFPTDIEDLIRNPVIPQLNLATDWVIYGAGGRGRAARQLLEAYGGRVLAYLDVQASQKGSIDGLECVHPEAALDGRFADAQCLIAVFNYQAPMAPIFQILENVPLASKVTLFDFIAGLPGGSEEVYWLSSRQRYSGWESQLKQARALLADDTSRSLFDAVLRLRLTGDWAPLERLVSGEQYFPHEVSAPHELSMLDGGACLGDALKAATDSGRVVQEYWAFEPDLQNFKGLQTGIAAGEHAVEHAILWPCGLGEQTAQLRFAAGLGTSSHLSEEGETIVPIVAFDDVLPKGSTVNYVKLDIEGAEGAALSGMRNMLVRNRPSLAVCVYHRPEDIWAILLQIEEYLPGSRYYLRCHAFTGFELVLYAVPE